MTDPRQERIDRLYAGAETKLVADKARTVRRGPVLFVSVCLALALSVGVVAVIDLRRLQTPVGATLAWTGAAVFGDCTVYRERSVPGPRAIDPRTPEQRCRDLRRRTEADRAQSQLVGIEVTEARSDGERARTVVRVTRRSGTVMVPVELRREDGAWVVVRTAEVCDAIGCA